MNRLEPEATPLACYESHVFTLRCTQRLLTRIKDPRVDVAANNPTTRLGDWYANLLHLGRTQLVLAVSERTFLPVVISAAPATTIAMRLRDGVVDILGALGVNSTDVSREVAEMETVVLGRTASRRVTGVLVDLAKGLDIYLDQGRHCLLAPSSSPKRRAVLSSRLR